jgi:exodeoxyribonuclease VIII
MMQVTHSKGNLIFDLSNEVYHGGEGYSSSQLKTILEDPEIFYRKYITKEIPRESNANFDVGTYFHTAILEPELLESTCMVYPGAVRSGKAWEEFRDSNSTKTIITKGDLVKATELIKAVNSSPIAMKLLKGSSVEVSTYVNLWVVGKDVYTVISSSVQILKINGWESSSMAVEVLEEFATKITVKVRADSIRIGEGVISDLKSTTGNCKNAHDIQTKVASYEYDLSTSLYLDIFTAATGELYDKFYWIFASKDKGNCKTWLASPKQIMVGRKKWKNAVVLLAECLANDWVFEDEVSLCEPTFYNAALLNEEF